MTFKAWSVLSGLTLAATLIGCGPTDDANTTVPPAPGGVSAPGGGMSGPPTVAPAPGTDADATPKAPSVDAPAPIDAPKTDAEPRR